MKKTILKYQEFLFPILDALINGANLFIHIYISWFLSKDEYGSLNAVFSFVTVIMVTGVSLQMYVAKQVSDPKYKKQDLGLIKYCQLNTLRILLVLIITSPFIKALLRVDLISMILVYSIFLVNSLVSIYRGFYQGRKEFLKLSRSFYIEIIIKVSMIALLLRIYQDKRLALLGVFIGMTLSLICDYYFTRQTINQKMTKAFKGYKTVFSANFFYYYLTSISLILCNYYLTSSGIFAVSIRYAQVFIHVGFSIITVIIPIMNKYKYDKALFKRQSTKLLLVCIGFGLLALVFYKIWLPSTIVILFGPSYQEAGNYILIQAIGYLLFVISSYLVAMEILIEKKKFTFYLLLASCFMTLGLVVFHKNIYQIIYVELATFTLLTLTLAYDFYKKEVPMFKKMHLLFLSWRDIKAPKKGGAEVFTHEMLKNVDKEQFQITHISPKFKGCQKDEVIDGVLYKRRGNMATVILYAIYFYFKHRKSIDYVIDQCNEHRFFTPFWLPRHKRIFFIHQFGRELWRRNLKFPFSEIGYHMEDPITKIYRKGYAFTVSPSTEKDLLDLGFDSEKVMILPEGINFLPWQPNDFKKKDLDVTFTYVGRFARYKGIDAALEAFGKMKKLYPNIKMWIVGKENEAFKKEVLLPIIEKYQLDLGKDIIFHGFVSEEKKLELMSRSYSLLYPSDREGWGLTVTEAAAVGTPSIVFNSPGLVDAVNQGQAGLIVDENSPQGLFNSMKSLIEDKTYYESIRNNAYEFSKKFQWEQTALVLEKDMFELKGVQS